MIRKQISLWISFLYAENLFGEISDLSILDFLKIIQKGKKEYARITNESGWNVHAVQTFVKRLHCGEKDA